ncbi:hypothetical protein BJ508DRAFT_313097 [Ascobolus immersus RN42]|uniref:Uncharacterized protein n=1 Tax=Ascobolus immersus RN42 TaxID=1160509 RepID=A0A3N4HNY5_ASCIM|nr:hypothetical protein BJ508DRAFT_313097 [Ascobolus immersus RN42]
MPKNNPPPTKLFVFGAADQTSKTAQFDFSARTTMDHHITEQQPPPLPAPSVEASFADSHGDNQTAEEGAIDSSGSQSDEAVSQTVPPQTDPPRPFECHLEASAHLADFVVCYQRMLLPEYPTRVRPLTDTRMQIGHGPRRPSKLFDVGDKFLAYEHEAGSIRVIRMGARPLEVNVNQPYLSKITSLVTQQRHFVYITITGSAVKRRSRKYDRDTTMDLDDDFMTSGRAVMKAECRANMSDEAILRAEVLILATSIRVSMAATLGLPYNQLFGHHGSI